MIFEKGECGKAVKVVRKQMPSNRLAEQKALCADLPKTAPQSEAPQSSRVLSEAKQTATQAHIITDMMLSGGKFDVHRVGDSILQKKFMDE